MIGCIGNAIGIQVHFLGNQRILESSNLLFLRLGDYGGTKQETNEQMSVRLMQLPESMASFQDVGIHQLMTGQSAIQCSNGECSMNPRRLPNFPMIYLNHPPRILNDSCGAPSKTSMNSHQITKTPINHLTFAQADQFPLNLTSFDIIDHPTTH